MFFFKNIDHEGVVYQIKCVIAGIEARLEGLKNLRNHEEHDKACVIDGFEGDTLDYGIANYSHQLEWLNQYLIKIIAQS
ncbi:hypothetical protein [Fusibacter sp. 3D3]|uniref:hypothetical protein n=1 Tax=Fusibacter sp. 3D3 TaxID=1048380 RepID=UPI000853CD76|nr:hypothetical protein [Fusibacter sp. 3D3]GAU78969.1 hypothetical protein F3D3_3605 [Fusibacter sp. 3D3]